MIELKQYRNNELVSMTRRYPKLVQKVLLRDAKIVAKIIRAWDIEHNSDKVFEIFLKEKNNLSDERYWELLRTVWILCGKIGNIDLFRELMQSTRKERYYFSTPEESKKLKDLPAAFDVYRATNNNNDGGLSWTLSKKYAKQYYEMFNKCMIITKTVTKEKVFAYIERNNESEIIILN